MSRGGFGIDFSIEYLKAIDSYLAESAIVWFCDQPSISNKTHVQAIQTKLTLCTEAEKIQHVYQVKTIQKCIEKLNKLTDRNVILLISLDDPLTDQQKSRLCSYPNVECIYQFGSEFSYIKLSVVFNNEMEVLQNESCLSDIALDITSRRWEDIDHPTKMFALKYILLEVLQQIPCTPKEKQDFIDFCWTICRREKDWDEICKYRNPACKKNAIWLYTGDSIIPHSVNRILREENLNSIIRIHFFTHDLYSDLHKLYLLQKSKLNFGIQLYRGKPLARNELECLKKSEGKYVVTDSFVSTSTDIDVAKAFAGGGNIQSDDKVSVIFSIKLRMKNNISKPVAFIREYSQKRDHEEEVLVSLGIVMRVISVKKNEVCI